MRFGTQSACSKPVLNPRSAASVTRMTTRSPVGRTASNSNGLFKTEVIRRRGPWRNMEAVEFATLEWVDWYNNRRLLEPIGNVPPAEAEARYYAQLEVSAVAA